LLIKNGQLFLSSIAGAVTAAGTGAAAPIALPVPWLKKRKKDQEEAGAGKE
jgi:hypothetical protein